MECIELAIRWRECMWGPAGEMKFKHAFVTYLQPESFPDVIVAVQNFAAAHSLGPAFDAAADMQVIMSIKNDAPPSYTQVERVLQVRIVQPYMI